MMLPKEVQKCQHLARGGKPYKLLSDLVDLVGIEPTTSSMPWNSSDPQIIDGTAFLPTGRTGKNGPNGHEFAGKMRAKLTTQVAKGLIRVGSAQIPSLCSQSNCAAGCCIICRFSRKTRRECTV